MPKKIDSSDERDHTAHGTEDTEIPPALAGRIEERWQRAYAVNSEEDLRRFYEDWARTYDEDHEAVGCFHHVTAARLMSRHVAGRDARVLDVGAGTGLAALELGRLGYRNIAAVDFSQAMLDVARKQRLYTDYWVMNLNRPLPRIASDSFDAAIGVGVFSYGQVQNGCLDEMLRIVRPGGCIVFTQRVDFHESNEMGFRDRQRALEDAGCWELVELTDPAPYLPAKEPDAMFRAWCYRVNDPAVRKRSL